MNGSFLPERGKRVLITGMSGTGKSSVVEELVARGYHAHDLDSPEWSEWVEADLSDSLTPSRGKDWVWRKDRVRALLSAPSERTLFVSGCAENMSKFYPMIDTVILLSAPVAVLMERLTARSAGRYGNAATERRKVEQLVAAIEPLLQKAADYEIDTTQALDATVGDVLRLAGLSIPTDI